MATKIRNSQPKLAVLALLLLVTLTLVYWNHFDNAFHFDDNHTIVSNQYVTDIANLPLFFKDAKTTSSLPTNQAYRPIVTSLNAVDYWLAGELDSQMFHWHIFLEFLLLLSVLYALMVRVFAATDGKKHSYIAFFATAFFAFHTATAETINYIIARSDGFSTLMVLFALLLYVRNNGWKKQLGLIPFIIGCLAKPTTLMLAPILLVYELLLVYPSLTVRAEQSGFVAKLIRSLRNTGSYFLIGAAMYVFTRMMFSDTWHPGNGSPWHYLITQPYIIWIYFKTFLLPTGLTADTDLVLIKNVLSPKVLLGFSLIVMLLVLSWFTSRKRSTLPIAFGILWFFIALIPSSSIIPLAEVMNHHRTFFPYIGLVMATSWGVFLLVRNSILSKPDSMARYGLSIVAVLFLGAHAYGTYQRNEVWDSEASLWRDVTIKSPNNGRGLMNYGLTEMKKGNIQEAIKYFKMAQNTSYGKHAYLYINLGIATNVLSNRTNDSQLKNEAEAYFKRAIQVGARFPQTHYRYADWLHKNDRSSDAFSYARKAIELSPGHKSARALLQEISAVTNQEIEFAKENAEIVNTPQAFLNLSLQYYNLGQYENCIEASYRALDLKPDYAPAYNNICSANNVLGHFDLAIEACEKALVLDPDHALARGNLNWARTQLKNNP